MSFEVKIPAVGESVTSGMISAWLKNDGDLVAKGDALLTLETDKVSTEITADVAGKLRIKAQAGAEVKIGEVVGSIEDASGAAVEKTCGFGPGRPSGARRRHSGHRAQGGIDLGPHRDLRTGGHPCHPSGSLPQRGHYRRQ